MNKESWKYWESLNKSFGKINPMEQKFSFNNIYYLNADVDNSVHKDLFLSISNFAQSQTKVKCDYRYVNSKNDFKDYLREIKSNIEESKFPFLHLTCHGNEKGIKLPSKASIKWSELSNLLAEINLKSKNNFFVVFACCEGAYFSLEMIKRVLRKGEKGRAPVFGYVASISEIYGGEIENSFSSFYEHFLRTDDLDTALDLLDSTTKHPIQVMSCRTILEQIVDINLQEITKKFSSNIALDAYLFQRLQSYFLQTGILPNYDKYSKLKQIVMDEQFYIDFYNRLRVRYYMIDLYEENKYRFPKIAQITNWGQTLKNVK